MTDIKTKVKATEQNFGQIWDEIKNKPLAVYGLQNQIVSSHFEPILGDNKKLVLKRVRNQPFGATLPAIEEILSSFILPTNKKTTKGPQPFGTPKEEPKFKYSWEMQTDSLVIKVN